MIINLKAFKHYLNGIITLLVIKCIKGINTMKN